MHNRFLLFDITISGCIYSYRNGTSGIDSTKVTSSQLGVSPYPAGSFCILWSLTLKSAHFQIPVEGNWSTYIFVHPHIHVLIYPFRRHSLSRTTGMFVAYLFEIPCGFPFYFRGKCTTVKTVLLPNWFRI